MKLDVHLVPFVRSDSCWLQKRNCNYRDGEKCAIKICV